MPVMSSWPGMRIQPTSARIAVCHPKVAALGKARRDSIRPLSSATERIETDTEEHADLPRR